MQHLSVIAEIEPRRWRSAISRRMRRRLEPCHVNDGQSDITLFLGRFHPLLVHLPIGGLVLLGILECLTVFKRCQDAARNRRWILGLVCSAAVLTAACGWLLARGGGYDPQLLKWHRMAGSAVTGVCVVTFLLDLLAQHRAYRISLCLTLLLLAVASHLGGSITHGRGFLTQYAPSPLRALLGAGTPQVTRGGVTNDVMEQPVFEGVIQPILWERCSACHGPEKHKGKLRLDSLEGVQAGGGDGPVIKASHAKDSPMVQRMRLPLDDDDHMPPDGKPQPTPEEIKLIEWWINAGAPVAESVDDLKPDPEIRDLLKSVSQRPESEK